MGPMKRLAAAVAMSFCSEGAIAQVAEPDWAKSPYGEEDRLGAANNLSPEGVVAAAGLVKTGKVYQLGVKTGPETPAYPGREYIVERIPSAADITSSDGSERVTAFDEKVTLSMGIGTQIDGLAHLGIDNRAYNGVPYTDLAHSHELDLSGVPPFVTRGVMIDMTKHFGVDALEAGQAFNEAEIRAAADAQGVTINKGDVVLFHTGWMGAKMESDPGGFVATQPGIGLGGAEYLISLGVVAIGADTAALEVIPFEDPARAFVVHQAMLAKTGTYILETIDTRELAADGVSEFMFVAAPPRFEGTVQIVVNPVAIG